MTLLLPFSFFSSLLLTLFFSLALCGNPFDLQKKAPYTSLTEVLNTALDSQPNVRPADLFNALAQRPQNADLGYNVFSSNMTYLNLLLPNITDVKTLVDTVLNFFVIDLAQLTQLLSYQNEQYHLGLIKDMAYTAEIVSGLGSTAEFKSTLIEEVSYHFPSFEQYEVYAGVFKGDAVDEDNLNGNQQLKRDVVMASVFNRLAANFLLPDKEKFSVTYNKKSYTTLPDFLQGLEDDHFSVSLSFSQSVVDFLHLHSSNTGGANGSSIPTALFLQTGLQLNGEGVVVPASEAKVSVEVRRGDKTEGMGFSFNLQWYGGVRFSGVRFTAQLYPPPSWTATSPPFDVVASAAAIRGVTKAGQVQAVLNNLASQLRQYGAGYGQLLGFQDPVALLQILLFNRTTLYPLLMNKELVLRALEAEYEQAQGPPTPTPTPSPTPTVTKASSSATTQSNAAPLRHQKRDLQSPLPPNEERARSLLELFWAVNYLPVDGGKIDQTTVDRVRASVPWTSQDQVLFINSLHSLTLLNVFGQKSDGLSTTSRTIILIVAMSAGLLLVAGALFAYLRKLKKQQVDYVPADLPELDFTDTHL